MNIISNHYDKQLNINEQNQKDIISLKSKFSNITEFTNNPDKNNIECLNRYEELNKNHEKLADIELRLKEIENIYDSRFQELMNYIKSNSIQEDPIEKKNLSLNENLANSLDKSNNSNYLIAVLPSCSVSNLYTQKFTTPGDQSQKIKINFIPKDEYVLSSKPININLLDKDYSYNSDKFKMNKKYITTESINFALIREEMKGYLNKYILFEKQYTNIIEIEMDDEQMKRQTETVNELEELSILDFNEIIEFEDEKLEEDYLNRAGFML